MYINLTLARNHIEEYRYNSNVRKDFFVLIRKRDLKIILL